MNCFVCKKYAKNLSYFDSFGVEHIPKEIKKSKGNRNAVTNIYRVQAYVSIICGYCCIGFIHFMLKGKSQIEIIILQIIQIISLYKFIFS